MTFMAQTQIKDSGWILISKDPNPVIKIRRVNNTVHIKTDGWTGNKIDLPDGFSFGGVGINATITQAQDASQSEFYAQYLVASGVLSMVNNPTNKNNPSVDDIRDLRPAMGIVEVNPKHELYLSGTGEETIWSSTYPPSDPRPLMMKPNQTDKTLTAGNWGIKMYIIFETPTPYPATLPVSL